MLKYIFFLNRQLLHFDKFITKSRLLIHKNMWLNYITLLTLNCDFLTSSSQYMKKEIFWKNSFWEGKLLNFNINFGIIEYEEKKSSEKTAFERYSYLILILILASSYMKKKSSEKKKSFWEGKLLNSNNINHTIAFILITKNISLDLIVLLARHSDFPISLSSRMSIPSNNTT